MHTQMDPAPSLPTLKKLGLQHGTREVPLLLLSQSLVSRCGC